MLEEDKVRNVFASLQILFFVMKYIALFSSLGLIGFTSIGRLAGNELAKLRPNTQIQLFSFEFL